MFKKLRIAFIAVVALGVISSCNKQLKEDIDDLEKKLAEEQAKTQQLQNGLGATSCANVRMRTNTDDDVAIDFTDQYCFTYGDANSDTYVQDNGDSTYYVYVEKYGNLDDNYTYISFTFNPYTGEKDVDYAYFRAGIDGVGDEVRVDLDGTTDITQTLVINSFDFNTGNISFSYTAVTTENYYDNYYSGKPMTVSIDFSGKLFRYRYNTSNR